MRCVYTLIFLVASSALQATAQQKNDTSYLTCRSLEFSANSGKVDTITCVTDINIVTLGMFEHLVDKLVFPKVSIPIVKANTPEEFKAELKKGTNMTSHATLYAGLTNAVVSKVRLTQQSGVDVEEISFEFATLTLQLPEDSNNLAIIKFTGTRP